MQNCALLSYTSLPRIQQRVAQIDVVYINKTHRGLHVKYPILTKFGICRQISIKLPPPPSIPNLAEIRAVAAALIHSDGRTDGLI